MRKRLVLIALAAAVAVVAVVLSAPWSGGGPVPTPAVAPGQIAFTPGVVDGSNPVADQLGVERLGARTVRFAINYEHVRDPRVAELVASYVMAGVTPQILYDFHGTMPSPAQVREITALAALPGVALIEFGNETSYSYQYGDGGPSSAAYRERARTYAQRFVEAAKALAPLHVGLLAQAGNGGTESSAWVDQMFAAEPRLDAYVAGWTVHPYGTHGPREMEEALADLARHGDTTRPIDVTEWGVSNDGNGVPVDENYGYPDNLSYAQAAALLREAVARYRAMCDGRLRSFFVYQVADDAPVGASSSHEDYFGALGSHYEDKGAYSEAVAALMRD